MLYPGFFIFNVHFPFQDLIQDKLYVYFIAPPSLLFAFSIS